MTTFSVPVREHDGRFFSFSVDAGAVLFAGGRDRTVPFQVCSDLIKAFRGLGFAFMTGCASGVDESFRKALVLTGNKDVSLIACAFRERQKRINEIYSLFVVPDGLLPKVALAKRTLWLTSKCSILILFPSDPMGKGSALAFKSAIYNSKPVFVVSKTCPKESNLYTLLPSNLFGVVDGFWAVPPVYQLTGLCHEAV
ncbi:MAG: hypothetical protein JXB50_05415 [Spirochaetes bacterium]|nr:hypothetical protein [Spirochaetota bacterium]